MLSFMIWVGIPLVLFIVGLVLACNGEILGLIVAVVFGFMLFLAVPSIPISRCIAYDNMAQFTATKQFCQDKSAMSETERYAIAIKAVEFNAWLISSQYWAKKPAFKIFWPSEILELTEIR